MTKSLFLPSTANTFTSNYANLPFKDISSQNYFKQVKEFRKPLFLSGQSMLDSKDNLYSNNSNNYANRIIISNPIINEISGKFVGLIGISLSTSDFFKRLGNIYDIRSQYMSVLDNNATHLVHSNVNLVGKNFFDDYTQTFTKRNKNLNMLMHNVLAGKPGTAIYSINNLGERLPTGFPIFLEDINKNRTQYMFLL